MLSIIIIYPLSFFLIPVKMNSTDTSLPVSSICENNWTNYLNIGLNFLIIALSITKQVWNSKSQSNLSTTVKAIANSNTNVNQQTEQVQLMPTEHLKASITKDNQV